MGNNELIVFNREAEAVRLTLHRPPLNFLSREMLRQAGSRLESLGDSPSCTAMILDSDLPAFSAGLEVSELGRDSIFLLLEELHHFAQALNSFARPTIALVRGMALGAANELLACCDFVFASDKASFGQPEVKIGMIPSLAPLLLPPLLGERRAKEMILTGNLMTAREAERIGLINRALPDAQVAGAAGDLLKSLAAVSLPVLEVGLRSIRSARSHELEKHLREIEALYLNKLMNLEDPLEGVRAFQEKRQPVWKNR